MREVDQCDSLDEVRTNIDRIDRQIVALIAEREAYVRQAARFKTNVEAVQAPQRVQQVIAKVTELARNLGTNPVLIERVYREMISALIETELAEHAFLKGSPDQG